MGERVVRDVDGIERVVRTLEDAGTGAALAQKMTPGAALVVGVGLKILETMGMGGLVAAKRMGDVGSGVLAGGIAKLAFRPERIHLGSDSEQAKDWVINDIRIGNGGMFEAREYRGGLRRGCPILCRCVSCNGIRQRSRDAARARSKRNLARARAR